MDPRLHAVLVVASFFPPAAAQDSAGEGEVSRHVVLQVEQEPDYAANDVVRMLGMNSYLGAIDPKMATAWQSLEDGRVLVTAALASQEIVTLTFLGANEAAIAAAREKLLSHLSSLTPTRRRTMQSSLARAEQDLAAAEKGVAALDAELAAFRDRHGGDVSNLLSEVQMLLRQHRGEATTVEDRLAVESATRDYLREAIRTRRAATGGAASDLEAEAAKLRKDLAAAKERSLPTHPEVVKLEHSLQEIESQLAAGGGDRSPNTGLEARLFAVEEEVFGLERRREWLKAQIAEKTELERSLAKVRDQWRSLELKAQQAEMRRNEARGAIEMLRRDLARTNQGEWIRVIAG